MLEFSQLPAEMWAAVRSELAAIALLKVEEVPELNPPYLRFHPTLAYAARPADVPEELAGAEQRFSQVYLGVMRAADEALRGRQPAAGMALLAGEEANLRRAIAVKIMADAPER